MRFLEPRVGDTKTCSTRARDVHGNASCGTGRIGLVRVDDERQLLDEAPVLLLGGALRLEEARVLDRDGDVRRDRGEQARVRLAEASHLVCSGR